MGRAGLHDVDSSLFFHRMRLGFRVSCQTWRVLRTVQSCSQVGGCVHRRTAQFVKYEFHCTLSLQIPIHHYNTFTRGTPIKLCIILYTHCSSINSIVLYV